MSRQYLTVPYAQKDDAKSLGARFDGAAKRWYVDSSADLSLFARWLPEDLQTTKASSSPAPLKAPTFPSARASLLPHANEDDARTDTAAAKGISLSQLLNGVASVVNQTFKQGVWTLVEVVEARTRGHVYMEVSERDGSGQPIAKARAMIWSSTAARILPEFERATGAVINAGIKLLVRAKPVFNTQYGFSLEIDAIDSEYTLGDLEARKKEIRERLVKEGLYERNRLLATPWDYRSVIVIAPEDAAGLGDFRKEAQRLATFGICQFHYQYSRFQGPGAAQEIVAAIKRAMQAMPATRPGHLNTQIDQPAPLQPDALVIIRGGGAVNDLAWLNDYDLAQCICQLDIPVITGIGHERDSTLPDEVAHLRFDTPSKVIAGIEQHILRRVTEAKNAATAIFTAAARGIQDAKRHSERYETQIRTDAMAQLGRARHHSAQLMTTVENTSLLQLRDAAAFSRNQLNLALNGAQRHLAIARQRIPALMNTIGTQSQGRLNQARTGSERALQAVLTGSQAATAMASRTIDDRMQRVSERAQSMVEKARASTEALVREVAGQGPEKTLARGFAIVRTADGRTLSSSAQAQPLTDIDIQFRDGVIRAQTRQQ